MQLSEWLIAATKQLKTAGIVTARLDVLILLEDCLQRDRAQLLAHPETPLNTEQAALLETTLKRRAKHEPLAYIRGLSEFYGRDFAVTSDVLIPRPESETIITLLKTHPAAKIIDVGTGSGALAISAKLELPASAVWALDADPACIAVARQNAAALQADITFCTGNLLEPLLQQSYNFNNALLLCNLPYVPRNYPINQAAQHEPALALFGGPDGLDLYRQLFRQIDSSATAPALILTESLPVQHADVAARAAVSGYNLAATDDFIQLFRLDKR